MRYSDVEERGPRSAMLNAETGLTTSRDERERHVLVVDDDANARELIREWLVDLGYRVFEAENGRRALDVLRAGAVPEVILLDLMMPVMSGWQFLEERRGDPELAAIPVVVFSAAMSAAAGLTDVAGHLRKPISAESLAAQMRRLEEGGSQAVPAVIAGGAEGGRNPGPDVLQAKQCLRVLLVAEDDARAGATQALLAEAGDPPFGVRRVRRWGSADTATAIAESDIVLLDLAESARAAEGVQAAGRYASGLPVVALTSTAGPLGRQELLRRGVADVVDCERQTPELLGRSLQHAYELHRLRGELEQLREIAAFERERRRLTQLAQPRTAVAAEMLGQVSLRRAAAARFDGLLADFMSICTAAVAEREHEISPSKQRRDLHKLADELAALRVGPGDIVDIYQESLPRMTKAQSAEHAAAIREEARLMLIGLLGYVLAAYRLHVGQEQRGGTGS